MGHLVKAQNMEAPSGVAELVDPDIDVVVWSRGTLDLRRAVQRDSHAQLFEHGFRAAMRLIVLLAVDTIAVLVVGVGIEALRIEGLLQLADGPLPVGHLNGIQFPVALVASMALVGAYGRGDAWRSGRRRWVAVALGTGLVFWAPLWDAGPAIVGLPYLFIVGAVSVMLAAGRGALGRAIVWSRGRGSWRASAVIVGDAESVRRASRSAVFCHQGGYEATQVVVIPGLTDKPIEVGAELARALVDSQAGAVFIAGPISDDQIRQVVEVSHSYHAELVEISTTLDIDGVSPVPQLISGVRVTAFTRPGLKAHEMLLKRVIDVSATLVGVIIIAPVLLVICLGVKFSSPGPVFFKQTRVGCGGRTFTLFKFRSMTKHAEAERASLEGESMYSDARLFKIAQDPRITPLGRFLRRSSLDEIPQLFNVLRGDMSLVGPRPPTPKEVELYESRHLCRFDVRPGITGPWQSGGRNLITDFEQIVQMEKHYIQNWSLGMDLKILLKTVPAVLKGVGAN
jgi:exopolysaccharide biosynthesis polyprenyl glycosylphosphotransferase